MVSKSIKMDLIRDYINKTLVLEQSTKIGRAAHTIKSKCQNYTGLFHPEFQSIDNLAGGIEGEMRGLKSNLVNNYDIRYFVGVTAKASSFMCRISDQSFFKDSTISEEIRTSVKELSQFIFDSIKTIEAEFLTATMKQSQALFGTALAQVVAVKPPGESVLDKFDQSASISQMNPEINPGIRTFAKWVEVAGEHLGNKAHQTQETVDIYLNDNELKPFANKIINLSGQVENEARNSIIQARKEEKMDLKAVKKFMDTAKEKLTEERKAIDELKILAVQVKEKLQALFGEQEKTIEKIVAIACKA